MWSVLIQWQVKKKVGKSRQVVHKSSGRVINLSLVHPFKPPFEPEGDGCLILHKILGAVSLLGAYKWNCSEHSDGSEEWYFFEVLSIYDVNLSSKMALMLCKKKKLFYYVSSYLEWWRSDIFVKSLSSSLFICNCWLKHDMASHSCFCAKIILFNGYVTLI